MSTPLSVVIGAGGTGGHIYPGLALAEALRRADPDAVVSFVGTERGLETTLIPAAGYRLHTVDMIPFDPALGAKRFLLPAALVRSGAQCRSILRTQGARVAVGMGGYPSAPVILGARMAGLPSVIHESNAVPGRANQFAARLTPHVTVAFDGSRAHLTGGQDAETVGMPVAATLAALDRGPCAPRHAPPSRYPTAPGSCCSTGAAWARPASPRPRPAWPPPGGTAPMCTC